MLNGSNAEQRKGYERHPLYFYFHFSHWSAQPDPVLLVASQDPPSLLPLGILGRVNPCHPWTSVAGQTPVSQPRAFQHSSGAAAEHLWALSHVLGAHLGSL